MTDGWVKLYRKLLDSPIWHNLNSDQKVVMINCLLKANHSAKKWIWNGEEITLNPGEMIISFSKFSALCGVSVQCLRTSVRKLEKFGFLTRTSTNKSTKLTICKWDTYQGIENQTNKQPNNPLTNEQQTTNKRLTTNKKVKNDNNDNNEKNVRPIFAPKNIEIIIEYFVLKSDKTEEGMAQAKRAAQGFWDEYESTNWKHKGSDLTHWQNRVNSWLSRWITNEEKKPTKKEEVKFETE